MSAGFHSNISPDLINPSWLSVDSGGCHAPTPQIGFDISDLEKINR